MEFFLVGVGKSCLLHRFTEDKCKQKKKEKKKKRKKKKKKRNKNKKRVKKSCL
jgi:hypothetical protein